MTTEEKFGVWGTKGTPTHIVRHTIILLQRNSSGREDTYTHTYGKLSLLSLPKAETDQHFQVCRSWIFNFHGQRSQHSSAFVFSGKRKRELQFCELLLPSSSFRASLSEWKKNYSGVTYLFIPKVVKSKHSFWVL